MDDFCTTGMVLQRQRHGDYDLILRCLTADRGRIAVMAKHALKSTRRFVGALELFCVLQMVCRPARRGDLAFLGEVTVARAFAAIRADILKTAYAGYWCELILRWTESHHAQPGLYGLLHDMLDKLNAGSLSPDWLSVIFQMRFLLVAGICPDLSCCGACHAGVDSLSQSSVCVDVSGGCLVCAGCGRSDARMRLSKGTLKQLQWISVGDSALIGRLRCSRQTLAESMRFLERFVPYHVGIDPRSLGVLNQLRRESSGRK